MAHSPRSGGSRRCAVTPPNQAGPGGNRAGHSYLPLDGSAHPGIPPHHDGGDRRHGCVPLGGMASPVHRPDHRFDVGTAKMPQPPSAVEPGRGAIPVNPWSPGGQPNRVMTEPEIPKEPR
jgi:hypothetical protein